MKNKDREKLTLWQDRLSSQESAYSEVIEDMDNRETLYKGSRELTVLIATDTKTEAVHVRNITAECIESQVDANIPQPKVTACYKEDEPLADIIENMIRNELDRMPFEAMNDMMSRTVPIQGGGLWLIEWDNTQRTHKTVGEIVISTLHPKQFIPQDGIYDRISDMDYAIIKVPATKEYINRKYDVNVDDEAESEPEVKGTDDEAETAADMVTQYVAYYRNDKGGIGVFSWVNDSILEDLEDYQARRLKRCTKCGQEESPDIDPMNEQTTDGTYPEILPDDMAVLPEDKPQKGSCKYCGSNSWEESEEAFETVIEPIMRKMGNPIPGMDMMTGEPTRIPYYKPDMYPVVLQKNVSVFGQLLGESDVDKITDQQNTTNIIHGNIIDKLLAGGSFMALPNKAYIKTDPARKKVIYFDNMPDLQYTRAIDMDEDISQDMLYLQQVYEEARQAIGITDSMQGRKDPTATSGKAKEFAAAQSAGRLESKRVMKNSAFAELFEAMFKFKLAYADESRPVVSQDYKGNTQYQEFNRYDFLKQDDAGEWYWNDRFIFACDTSSPLASNREAMWQETRLNLTSGALGDPANPQTQLLFWTIMEQLHYPISGQIKQYMQDILQQQQAQAQQAQQMQAQQMQGEQRQQQLTNDADQQRAIVDVKRQAREDAMKAAQVGRPEKGIK